MTPSSYPQTPAELIDNPAFWERLDTDVLFFAFYYQQVWVSDQTYEILFCIVNGQFTE